MLASSYYVKTKTSIVFLCLTFLFGCDGDTGKDSPTDGSTTGFTQFINIVPDAPRLTAKVDDTFLSSAIYGQSGAFKEIDISSTYDLDIYYTDAIGDLQSFIPDQSLNIGADADTNVLIAGSFADPMVIQIENAKQDIDDGDNLAEIQFVHAATLSNTDVDFYLTAPSDSLSVATAHATLAFQDFSVLTQIDSSAEYRIRLTESGNLNVIWDSGSFSLNRLSRNLVVALDYFGPGTNVLRAVKIDLKGTSNFPAEVLDSGFRFTNTIADSIAVDFYFGDTGGTPMFANISFGDTTGYIQLASGPQSVNVTPVGINTTFLYEKNINLLEGEFRNLVTAGNSFDANVGGRLLLEENRRIATESRLRVIQASSSADLVDFYLLKPGQSIEDASAEFGSLQFLENGVLALEEGSYDVVITPVDQTTLLLGPERIVLAANGIYTITISDFTGGGTPIKILLGDDFP